MGTLVRRPAKGPSASTTAQQSSLRNQKSDNNNQKSTLQLPRRLWTFLLLSVGYFLFKNVIQSPFFLRQFVPNEPNRQVIIYVKSNQDLPAFMNLEKLVPGTMWEDTIYYYGNLNMLHTTKKCPRMDPVDPKMDKRYTDIAYVDIQSQNSPVIVTNYSSTSAAIDPTLPSLDRVPPLLVHKTSQPPFASCQFKNWEYSAHMPHYMQQLYRCWSFWNQYPHHKPVLITTHRKSNHYRRAMQRPFTSGLSQLMPQMGIEVMDIKQLSPVPDSNTTTMINDDAHSISVVTAGPFHAPEDTSFQVASIADMHELRRRVLDALDIVPSPAACHDRPRVAILNRRKTRRIVNVQDLQEGLSLSLFGDRVNSSEAIPVVFLEGKSFEDQVKTFADIDILITPHGAQETGIVFMPPCGAVLELIPNGYYYPNFFGTLAATCGLGHAFLYFGSDLTKSHNVSYSWNNMTIRSANFCPSRHIITSAVEALQQQRGQCCRGFPERPR